MWGRAKIGPLLSAEGFKVSDATVGRILAELEPGGLVQLDTVFVNLPPKAIKHFTAYDPIAKWTVGKAFNRASAQAAAAFLDKIIADMPFPVKAIQADGGSEFMAEFEVACQTKAIALYVLPPRSPQMNGAVEAMTTNRLGGVPSSGVIFSVKITYLPPKATGVSGPDLAGTALKPSGSVMSLISTTT